MTEEEYKEYLEYLEKLDQEIKKTSRKISNNGPGYNRSFHYLNQKEQQILSIINQNVDYKVKGVSDKVYAGAGSIATGLSDEYINKIMAKEITDMAGNEFKNTGLYSRLIRTDGKIINAANIGKAGRFAEKGYGEFLNLGNLMAVHNVAEEAQKYKRYKEGKGTEKGDPGKQLILEAASWGASKGATKVVQSGTTALFTKLGAEYGAFAGPAGIVAGALAGYLVSEYGDDVYAAAEKHGNKVWEQTYDPLVKKYRNKKGELQYKPSYSREILKSFNKSKAPTYGFAASDKYKQQQMDNYNAMMRQSKKNKSLQRQNAAKKSTPKKKENFFSRLKRQLWGLFKHNANGSFVDNPMLSWVGEEGPEVIIPLSGHKRDRGLDLWQQAGQALGVTGYANGGMVGGAPGKQSAQGTGQAKGGIRVSVGNINISLKSSGGGGKSTNLLSALKEQKEEVSDELCNILADALESAYQNISAVS